jgi:hypothetical protein
LGDTFTAVVVFAVEIAAGLEIVFAVVGLSVLFATFVPPFVCPFEGPLAAFFSSTFAGFVTSIFRSGPPVLLSILLGGVSMADFGIVS